MANNTPNLTALQTIKFVDNMTGYEYGQLTGDRARQFAQHALLIRSLGTPETVTVTVPIGLAPEELRFLLYIVHNIPVAVLGGDTRPYYDYIEQFDEHIKRKTLGYFGIDLQYQNALLPTSRLHPIVERVKERALEVQTNENTINGLVNEIKMGLLHNEAGIQRNNLGAARFLLQKEQAKLERARANIAGMEHELETAPVHRKPTREQENAIRARVPAIQARINKFTRRVGELQRERDRRMERYRRSRRGRGYSESSYETWDFRDNNSNNYIRYWNNPEYYDQLIDLRAKFLAARRNILGIPQPDPHTYSSLNWEWQNDPLLEKIVRNHVRSNRTNRHPLVAYKGSRNQAPPKLKAEIEKKVAYRAKTLVLWATGIQSNYAEAHPNKVSANNRKTLKTKKLLMESTINMNRPNALWGNLN